ncbi:Hypothetical protein CINCED_3A017381 [Cinara cedri]|uniref:Uncharacterized protein n=1 Tax=Cinara cedri TaxID=506608 RepID=A0A5E4MQP6_9HEMI|nr:Hypothetical protein CINCED_3A017381 [Cinara cedri]
MALVFMVLELFINGAPKILKSNNPGATGVPDRHLRKEIIKLNERKDPTKLRFYSLFEAIYKRFISIKLELYRHTCFPDTMFD